MKKVSKCLSAIIIFALVFTLLPFRTQVNAASKPKFSKKSITLEEGKSKTITVNANGNKIKSITFKSSDKSIAKVTKYGKLGAKIKGVSYGTTIITATVKTKDKKYDLSLEVSIVEDKAKIQKLTSEQSVYIGTDGTIYIDLYADNIRDLMFFIKEGETRYFNILTNNRNASFIKWKNSEKDIIKLSGKTTLVAEIKGKKEGRAFPYASIAINESDVAYGLFFNITVVSKDTEITEIFTDMNKSTNDDEAEETNLYDGLITYNDLLNDDDYEIIYEDNISPTAYPTNTMCADAIRYTVLTKAISANMNYEKVKNELVVHENDYGIRVFGLAPWSMNDYVLDILEDNEKRSKDNKEYSYVADIISAKVFNYYLKKGPQKGCEAPGIVLTYKLNDDPTEYETDTFFYFAGGVKPGLPGSGKYSIGGTSGFLDSKY